MLEWWNAGYFDCCKEVNVFEALIYFLIDHMYLIAFALFLAGTIFACYKCGCSTKTQPAGDVFLNTGQPAVYTQQPVGQPVVYTQQPVCQPQSMNSCVQAIDGFCPNCGAAKNSSFCANCGAKTV
jgi:hypothetical protein